MSFDTYSKEEEKSLLEGLLQVREQVLAAREGSIDKLPWSEAYGICHAVRQYLPPLSTRSLLYDTFKKCPSFSGFREFPVKHPNENPDLAFITTVGRKMWFEGEYADNRIQLLEEVIEVLKKTTQIG